ARDREKVSRSRFAQHTIDPRDVADELVKVRTAIGSMTEVRAFLREALTRVGVPLTSANGTVTVHVSPATPRGMRQAIGRDGPFSGVFDLPAPEGAVYLHRSSPVVEGVASWVLDQALDPAGRDVAPVAARCAVT